MRCFLAVPLAEPALGEAQRLLGRLRAGVGAARWARPETLHVTVHFFGQIDGAGSERALAAIAPVAAATSPFQVSLDRLGSFPPRGAPRVLWLGSARDAAPMTRLALDCRAALNGSGFSVEERAFRAHCTLGRPRLPWPGDALEAWQRALSVPLHIPDFAGTRLVLYESTPAPGGSIYLEREVIPLGLR